ncbi:MAG: radical SAM protein [Alistipes sp.]|nr:radical SAM protein [Alistipes sp.]
MTALYTDIIYGPVRSRRLGLSLGVNLLPLTSKLCSFDCIYCECGWNDEHRGERRFNTRVQVREALEATLVRMSEEGALPDVITFAGNGEPTMHPDFEGVIDDTLALRDHYAPQAKVSVLSNATQLHRNSVCDALRRVDNNILKLDSAFDATVQAMNKPCGNYTVADIVERLKTFEGNLIVQTMFLRGECDGKHIDNTTNEEVEAWLRVIGEIAPRQVMIYSIARDTPCQSLEKVSKEELERIAEQVSTLGISCSVA